MSKGANAVACIQVIAASVASYVNKIEWLENLPIDSTTTFATYSFASRNLYSHQGNLKLLFQVPMLTSRKILKS